MANVDRPNGFKPVKHLNGAPYNGQARKYEIPATDSTDAVGVGDLVVLSDQNSTTGYAAVEVLGAAGADLSGDPVGVVVGFLPVDATGGVSGGASPTLDTPLYRLDDTKKLVLVADSPDLLFEVQEDSTGGSLTLAAIGQTITVVSAGPSTTTGRSTMEIDSSQIANDATDPIQVLELVQRPDNAIGTNARWLVRINTHAYATDLAGV
jgi:hypothetical protein